MHDTIGSMDSCARSGWYAERGKLERERQNVPALLPQAWPEDEPTTDASASPAARGAELEPPPPGARCSQCPV